MADRLQPSFPFTQAEVDLLDLLPAAVTLTGPSGTLVHLNSTACELLGWTREEAVGRHVQDVFNVMDAHDHEKNIEQAQRTDTPPRFRFTARTKGGTPVAMEFHSRPFFDAKGKLVGALGIGQRVADTTPELPADELRFRRLLDSTAEGVFEVDLTGKVTFVNRAGLKLLGYEFDYQLVGKPMSEVFRFASGDTSSHPVFGGYAPFDANPLHARVEKLLTHSGVSRAVEVFSHPVTRAGVPLGRALTVLDVEDRVTAEERQRRTDESFMAMMDVFPDAVVVHQNKSVIYANKRLLSLMGATSEELMAMNMPSLFSNLSPEQLREVEARSKADLPTFVPEWRLPCKGGSVVTMEARGFGMTFRGKPARVVLGRDLHERKELETQMRMNERLASLGTLAAGMAHEINNPLAYIGNNLDFLFTELGDLAPIIPRDRSEGIIPALSDSIDGVRRIGEIVGHLKTLTRSSEEVESLSLEDCLDHALKLASNQVIHRAQIRRQIGPLPQVRGNATRLTQVFVNLLVNAAQAIPEGSAERNLIYVRAFTNEHHDAIVEVQDTGEGISPEVQKRVFDPFFTTKPVGVGTGLGLSICHGIVATYGGEITLESQPGAGTTVRVRLPSDTTTKPGAQPTRAAPKPPRLRMLVIDDEAAFLRALRRSLAEHDVVTMSNAQSGLDAIRGGVKFDLVLCDVMMPQMTGEQFYAQLKAADPELAARTLFMTGGTFSADANKFVEERPAVLRKPFAVGELREAIAKKLSIGTAGEGSDDAETETVSTVSSEAPTVIENVRRTPPKSRGGRGKRVAGS